VKPSKLRRRGEILVSSAKVFCENGYRGTNVRELGNSLGVEAASLYNYFDSKEAILRTVCYDMLEFAESAKVLIASTTGSPEEKLVAAMKVHIELIKTHSYSSTVYLHDWRYMTNPEDYKGFKAHKESYELLFSNILAEGMKSGVFKVKNHSQALSFLFASMNWVVRWDKIEEESKADTAETVKTMTELVLKAFK
jgi:AcrR family transcriptional regulator